MAKTPDEISSVSNIGGTKPIQVETEQQPKSGQTFESFMKEGTGPSQAGIKTEGITPLELAGQSFAQGTTPTVESILGQMNSTSTVLGDVQNQLQTKNLKLKPSQKYLLRNKLTSAHENIRAAAEKSGVDVGEPPSTSLRQSPIAKFLSIITDGQAQLGDAHKRIQTLAEQGTNLNPGELLMVQIKLAKAQQELEYSSILLSKAVDDIKTMFNIQI